MRKVADEADLIGLLNASYVLRENYLADFFIALNGNGRSSKYIEMLCEKPLDLWVNNQLDNTDERLSGDDWTHSYVRYALDNGALFCNDGELLDFTERGITRQLVNP
jgi:hypothetical protein